MEKKASEISGTAQTSIIWMFWEQLTAVEAGRLAVGFGSGVRKEAREEGVTTACAIILWGYLE